MSVSEKFSTELDNLRGMSCWGIVAGEGTGSRATLHFGKKLKRTRTLNNPTLPDALKRFEGEFVLFIQNCAWRLDTDRILCTSKSSNENEGPLVRGLRSLIDQRVVGAQATYPSCDLTLEFSTTAKLRLFCDCVDEERDGDNYALHATSEIFVVPAGSDMRTEVRRATQTWTPRP
jgi:hypothetical protein